MPKIITVRYEQTGERKSLFETDPFMALIAGPEIASKITVSADPEKAFNEAMDRFAEHYKSHGANADFGIVDSSDISDICFSSQWFFGEDAEAAFKRHGIKRVKIAGLMGGSYEYILERIRQKAGPDLEFLDGIQSAEHGVLYEIKRRK